MERQTAEAYQRFAELEARGVSDIYYEWSNAIAADPEVLALITKLPAIKKQANLVFSAARFLGAPVGPYKAFRSWLMSHWTEVVPVVMQRATQTNEAARCAVLLPILSRLDGQLALIEAGASAGLCLYPDLYSYRYDVDGTIVPLDPSSRQSAVVIPCTIDAASVPTRVPTVAWRSGVDLSPVDVRDPDQVAWLEMLVWSEHESRRERLHAAARLAATAPAHLVRGDLLEKIPELIKTAPAGSRVVVFHSAVLVYLEAELRERFAKIMSSFPEVTWVSNEGAGVLPSITEQVNVAIDGRTILAVDGKPIALVGPHGQSYEAL